ncbi:MAG TPA: helix-turn-helix transcriptional regulator [Gemmatimonadaceae bacterium]|nr:helix-turn-helix transcriptional regulator [Gemmatimonadaceae bacterium]
MSKRQPRDSDSPLGSFEEHVMLAIARVRKEAYAVNVRREIEARTDREIAMGAVYATLDRLEAKELVASWRESVDQLSRRMFALTTEGIAALAETRNMRDRLWHGLDLRKIATRVV